MVIAVNRQPEADGQKPVVERLTLEEYLVREEQAEFKSEFINGEILPVAGATANHNRLAINFCRLLPMEVGGQSFEIFMSDM